MPETLAVDTLPDICYENNMSPISKNRMHRYCGMSPRFRNFQQCSGIREGKEDRDPSFSVPFRESIALIYHAMTDLRLDSGATNYYHYMHSPQEVEECKEWVEEQGSRHYIRDCLTCSIALDRNFVENSNEYTLLGRLEHKAKSNGDLNAAKQIAKYMRLAINKLPYYRDAPFIAAVPPKPGKPYDLPSHLVEMLAKSLGIKDITSDFEYLHQKVQIKELPWDQKWDALAESELTLHRELHGEDVILIDDKYQSGITANYVGMLLQRQGAGKILGLYAVKTRKNTGNV